MEEIRTLLINRSSPSSSSRQRRSSHKSSERKNDASASRPRPHLHGDHHHIRDPHRMKDKSPPSNMCTSTTDDIYYELKHDNDIIIMKMLHKRKCTSPKKPYFTPRPSFKSTKEDRETTTTKTALRLHQPLWHLRQVLSRHLCLSTYGIFTYFPCVRLHQLHQVQGDYL